MASIASIVSIASIPLLFILPAYESVKNKKIFCFLHCICDFFRIFAKSKHIIIPKGKNDARFYSSVNLIA